jgi:hypothetical protein
MKKGQPRCDRPSSVQPSRQRLEGREPFRYDARHLPGGTEIALIATARRPHPKIGELHVGYDMPLGLLVFGGFGLEWPGKENHALGLCARCCLDRDLDLSP